MVEITFKVNTRTLTRQLNELKLSQMGPTELENFIKNNLEVVRIGNSTDVRFYVKLKEEYLL